MEVYRQVFGMQEDVPFKWLRYSFFFFFFLEGKQSYFHLSGLCKECELWHLSAQRAEAVPELYSWLKDVCRPKGIGRVGPGRVCGDSVSWSLAAGSGDDWTVPANILV